MCLSLLATLVAGCSIFSSSPITTNAESISAQIEDATVGEVPDYVWETRDHFVDNLREVYARDDLQEVAAIVAGREITKEHILVQRASLNVRSHVPNLSIREAWEEYAPWLAIYYDRHDRGTVLTWEEARRDHEENSLTDERWWMPIAEVRGMSYDEYTEASINQVRIAMTVQREIADHIEELFRTGIPDYLLPFLPAEEGDLPLELLARRMATEQFLDSQRNIVPVEIVWDELR